LVAGHAVVADYGSPRLGSFVNRHKTTTAPHRGAVG
jgi:hypothetical protein